MKPRAHKVYRSLASAMASLYPHIIAKQLAHVQPMDTPEIREAIKTLCAGPHLTHEQLREQGYRPVSSLGLMWVKDERIEPK